MGVVVVNYRSHALVRANLGGVRWPPGVAVVVVDNASTPAERTAVAAVCAQLGHTLVPMASNDGFAAGCNAGVQQARRLGCSTFLFLNPDAVVTPEVVEALRAATLADRGALVAPVVVDPAGVVTAQGARLSMRDGRIRSRPGAALADAEPWVTAACLAVHGDLLTDLGGMPEGYFLYWEDVELSHRCLQAGGRVVVRPDLRVVHDQGGTQGRRRGVAKSALYYRWNTRNRLVFAARNLPRRQALRWLLATPAVSTEILLRGGRRQLLHTPDRAVAALRGSAEGALVVLRELLRPPGRRRPQTPTRVVAGTS